MHILILNLVAFAKTGGVEKVSRILSKAGSDIAMEISVNVHTLSLYDDQPDTRYSSVENYTGFKKNKPAFLLNAIKQGRHARHLILTHIHLALPALLIKLINPRVKIHLIAHGIEIWNPVTKLQQYLLQKCDRILAVSAYTEQRIADKYPGTSKKIRVLNNCLDPFYQAPASFEKPPHILKKYGIQADEKVLITLCRLASSEKYKGYDNVLHAIKELKNSVKLKYLILGKYDQPEYKRLLNIIEKENLEDIVILPGFISEDQLTDHLLAGDLFIMPSIKEGFGIAFIEAAAAGLPLIGGNKDGSIDALLNGRLGQLIDPQNHESIKTAITNVLEKSPDPYQQQLLVLKNFGYKKYSDQLKSYLS